MPEAQIFLKQPRKGQSLLNYDVFDVNFERSSVDVNQALNGNSDKASGLKGRSRQFTSNRRAACRTGMLRAAWANECPLMAIEGTCQGHTVNLRELLEQFEKGAKNKDTKITRTNTK